MRPHRVCIPIIVLASTVVAGCASAPLDSSATEATNEFADLRGLWGKLLAPYRLTARFPPDESTKPGDIFVVCHNADRSSREAFPAERIGNLFVTPPKAVARPSHDRFYPAMPDKTGKIQDSKVSQGPRPALPIASFPALVSELGDAKNFGISLPTCSGLWGFGGSKERKLYYTLSIPIAEVSEVPRLDFYKALESEDRSILESTWRDAQGVRETFTYHHRAECPEVRLAVVRQTYATRRFSVSMSAGSAGAIGGQMQMALGKEKSKVVQALTAYSTDDEQKANEPAKPVTAGESKDAEITRLRQALLAKNLALDLGFPGARGESANSSEASVSLEYVFDVPVVFAVSTIWEDEIDCRLWPPSSDDKEHRCRRERSKEPTVMVVVPPKKAVSPE